MNQSPRLGMKGMKQGGRPFEVLRGTLKELDGKTKFKVMYLPKSGFYEVEIQSPNAWEGNEPEHQFFNFGDAVSYVFDNYGSW